MEGQELLKGYGIISKIVSGKVSIIKSKDDLNRFPQGNILVAGMTSAEMIETMKKSVGVITDHGGATCHAATVGRELGIPTIVGTGNATSVLNEDALVTLDCRRGRVYAGGNNTDHGNEEINLPDVITATEIRANLSMPEAARRAKAAGADGVGLLRLENVVLSFLETPASFFASGRGEEYRTRLRDRLREIVDIFYPRPVRLRTLDLPTDEFEGMAGCSNEQEEHNPMLGYRGLRRDLCERDHFMTELAVFKDLWDEGYNNVEILFPFLQHVNELILAKEMLVSAGIDLKKVPIGIMVETPAAAIGIEDYIKEGIHFIVIGTNDLIQFTLAVDRNNEKIGAIFDTYHPAVLSLIRSVIGKCREAGIATSICGESSSSPPMVEFLVRSGISAISVNVDDLRKARVLAHRAERRMILQNSICSGS